MDPQKLVLMFGLMCIIPIFTISCSLREDFSGVDVTRGKNARALSYQNNTSWNAPNSNAKYRKSSGESKKPQTKQINKMVDRAVKKFNDYIRETIGGKMPVPDISMEFSSGTGFFSVNVVFIAKAGVFGDLTTVRRKSDAIVRRTGHKLSIVCALGPLTAEVEYDYINMIYGYFNMQGSMIAELSPLTFVGQISADYSRTPCVTKLEHFKVSEMGPIKTIISGIGSLSQLVNGAVDRYIRDSEDHIRRMIEVRTAAIIMSRLPHFNCEAYRQF